MQTAKLLNQMDFFMVNLQR